MNIIKPCEGNVYDNLYAKPASIDDWTPHSMQVLYSVNSFIYCGQYNSETRIWNTLPSDEKMREFKDKEVEYWFYQPGTMELFEKSEPYEKEKYGNQELSFTEREFISTIVDRISFSEENIDITRMINDSSANISSKNKSLFYSMMSSLFLNVSLNKTATLGTITAKIVNNRVNQSRGIIKKIMEKL
jgi:hypothetical protein